jgi:hypothetical protein
VANGFNHQFTKGTSMKIVTRIVFLALACSTAAYAFAAANGNPLIEARGVLASPKMAAAVADQGVRIVGAVVNTVGGIVIPGSGCAPELAVTGFDLNSKQLLQLCTTNDSLNRAAFTNLATVSGAMEGTSYSFIGTIIGKGQVFAVREVSGHLDDSNEERKCTSDARTALAKKLNLPANVVTFSDGAIVGDAADAVEIDMFQVTKRSGFYKVEMDGEMCDLRNIERVNN